MIYDRTTIKSEEKIFVKNVLGEIDALVKKNHRHNTSLVLEFCTLNSKSVDMQIQGGISSLCGDKRISTIMGDLAPAISLAMKQAKICGGDTVWEACEIKKAGDRAFLIGLRGYGKRGRVDMVSFVSDRDITTEVNILTGQPGTREVETRVLSKLSNGVLIAKELTSSLDGKRALYRRHLFMDIPATDASISIIEEHKGETKKRVLYERNYNAGNAKAYDFLYDDIHSRPEDALRYVMTESFKSIALPPRFLTMSEEGKQLIKEKRKPLAPVKKEGIKPMPKKKMSQGASKIDAILANAKKKAESEKS